MKGGSETSWSATNTDLQNKTMVILPVVTQLLKGEKIAFTLIIIFLTYLQHS